MSSAKTKSEFRVGVGASSILMVLVVVAMTAVALLSFSGARNAEVLAKRSVEMSSAYYQGAADVQLQLAILDEMLSRYDIALTPNEADALSKQLVEMGLQNFSFRLQGKDIVFSFGVDAKHEREIQVEGRVLTEGSPRYQLTRHELVSLETEDGGQYFTLMGE